MYSNKINKSLRVDYFLSVLWIGALIPINFIDFPHKTKDFSNILLSVIVLVAYIIFHFNSIRKFKLYSLEYLFNATWLLSFWLALLKLSDVQKDLTGGFIFYLTLTLLFFNFGIFLTKVGFGLSNYPRIQSKPTHVFEEGLFLFGLCISVIICITGYVYEIRSVGFIPLLQASEDGFYGNDAEYLSGAHHLSTSLGALSGAALAFSLISKRFKYWYIILFLASALCAVSMLAKNIIFLSVAFCLALLNFYGYLTRKRLIYSAIFFAMGTIGLMNIRLGSSDYISTYSRINFEGLPQAFYWINTYFAINITHLNTYFDNGYTSTYGWMTFQGFISLLGLKSVVADFIGERIVYFNGLGGYINVVPLTHGYLSDFGLFSVFAFIPLGYVSKKVDYYYNLRYSYFVALLFAGFSYALGLSVFGNFIHPLMIYISIFFVFLPFFFIWLRNKFKLS